MKRRRSDEESLSLSLLPLLSSLVLLPPFSNGSLKENAVTSEKQSSALIRVAAAVGGGGGGKGEKAELEEEEEEGCLFFH